MISSRRYDLDWVRIIAFGILIYFHTAIIFIPQGLPLIRNAEYSLVLQYFVNISSQFRLSLLFFISGVGVHFARRRRSTIEFIKERMLRLGLPLIFGILVLVPPMVYTEKLFLNEYSGSYFGFYSQFFTQGVYPKGNLSWHHFWFLAYLLLFCLISIRLFIWLENNEQYHLKKLLNHLSGFGIFLPLLPLWAVELFIRPAFPGFRDLIHDWASFTHWLIIFVCGYAIANRESLLDFTQSIRWLCFGIASCSTALILFFFNDMDFGVAMSDPYVVHKYMIYAPLKVTMIWSTILFCLGMAGHYCQRPSATLQYLNEAVYPLFILHLPVTVILGYWVVPYDWGVWPKYLLISNITVLVVLVFYHFAIKPFNVMRLLFGMRGHMTDKSTKLLRSSVGVNQ